MRQRLTRSGAHPTTSPELRLIFVFVVAQTAVEGECSSG